MKQTPKPNPVQRAGDDDVRGLLWSTGLTCGELAQALGRDPRTVNAWSRGRPMPYVVRLLLEIFAGRMPWRGFDGYQVVGNTIVPPGSADGVDVPTLAVLPYQMRRLELIDAELARLRSAPAQYLLDLEAPAR